MLKLGGFSIASVKDREDGAREEEGVSIQPAGRTERYGRGAPPGAAINFEGNGGFGGMSRRNGKI